MEFEKGLVKERQKELEKGFKKERKKELEKELEKELKKELQLYKEQNQLAAKEEKIRETIKKSRDVFFEKEQQHSVPYFQFLLAQFRFIRKRWWILQTVMLVLVFLMLPYLQNKASVLRVLGVIGVLFVVLIIPEFWKNKSYACMQIEGTCLYSLRQIYTARMIWFGMVDLFILTGFCSMLHGQLGLATAALFVQFLFPMLVAACICFGTLCSKMPANEGTAILFCMLWNAVWCFIILNELVYQAITAPIWCALFVGFLVFLAGAVSKTILDCNNYWEVDFGGTTNG